MPLLHQEINFVHSIGVEVQSSIHSHVLYKLQNKVLVILLKRAGKSLENHIIKHSYFLFKQDPSKCSSKVLVEYSINN